MSDYKAFEKAYTANIAQILTRRVVSDLDTPVSAFMKLAGGDANAFLLESVEGGDQLGRYSIIGLDPDAVWRAHGAAAALNTRFQSDPAAFAPEADATLTSLKRFIDASRIDLPEDAPPMAAGVFGYFSYDVVREIEQLPNKPPTYADVPDAIMLRPQLVAVFDNVRQEIILVTPVRPANGVSAGAAYDAAQDRLDAAVAKLSAPIEQADFLRAVDDEADAALRAAEGGASNTTTSDYFDMVKAAKDHILAGDIFQVVLSQRFETPFSAPPFELYRALRRTNPSPFLFYLNFDSHALIGSSPEILVRVRDGDVTIRPIAGTRPRGANIAEDKALERDLLADPKERAEHLMLLDLGRNDVGRSAAIGSVRVTDQFTIERYSHVMHIVSNVVGRLREDLHPVDAMAAGFPAGTVTGAPKVRAMEIIDDLEKHARGPYGGTIGYFSANGDVDTCIALRTAMVLNGTMYVQAGAGIVADSDPQKEHEECINKARALFAAARAALSR